MAIAVVAGIIGLVTAAMSDFNLGWFLLAFALFIAFEALSILPHELGHALAALAVGMRVFTISIGSGSIAYTARVFGYDFVFRRIPLGGYTLFVPKSTRFVRLRTFLVILCGPLVNLVLIVAAVAIAQHLARPNDSAMFVASVFIFANVILLIINLIPHKISASGLGHIPNDGLSLLTRPFMSRKAIEELHSARFYLEGLECRERGGLLPAKDWFEQGLRVYPTDLTLLSGIALVDLELGKYDDARRLFVQCLEQAEGRPDFTALFQNNIAWTNLMIGKQELLSEADDFSSRGLAMVPWEAAFKGTRGSVLVELGRIDEAVHLLDQAFDENTTNENKAFNACYLALAMCRKGEEAEANRFIEQARSLDDDCPLLGRVEREVEERRAVACATDSRP